MNYTIQLGFLSEMMKKEVYHHRYHHYYIIIVTTINYYLYADTEIYSSNWNILLKS